MSVEVNANEPDSEENINSKNVSSSLVDEYKLLVDTDGKYKQELFDKFNRFRKELKNQLQQGCRQEDYVLYNRFLESIDVAQTVVDRVWMLAREQSEARGVADNFNEAIG